MVWSLGPIVLGVITSISSQRDVNAVPSPLGAAPPHHPGLPRSCSSGTSGQHSGGTVTEAGVFVQAMTVSAEVALHGDRG